VILIEDDAGKRILAYVTPHKRGGGFGLHVQDYGGERRVSTENVQAAAKAVKSSKRRQPKATKAKAGEQR
jgi:hypothetical protein